MPLIIFHHTLLRTVTTWASLARFLHFLAQRSRARWQLNATRASCQSSRKRATISPDQFCPMTSKARHSTLCSCTSKEDVHSLPVPSPSSLLLSGLFGQPSPHMSPKIRREVTVRQRVLDDYRVRLYQEEEELAVRPILLRDIPDAGCRAQSHKNPTEPGKATSLPTEALTAIVVDIRLNKATCEPNILNIHRRPSSILDFTSVPPTNTIGFEIFLECLFLMGWVIKRLFSVSCRFHGQQSPCLSTLPRLLCSHRLVQLFAVVIHRLPILSLDSLVNGMTNGMPVRINLRRSSSLGLHVGCVDEGAS